MESEYVILRRTEPAAHLMRKRNIRHGVRSLDFLQLGLPAEIDLLAEAKTEGFEAHEAITVEHATLNAGQAAEITRDDSILAGAPVMPMGLIAPLAAGGDGETIDQAKTAGITWGVQAIGADKSELTGKDIVAAVLDTGVDPDHAAFKGMALSWQDFTGSGVLNDDHGHGTHCAGIAFGRDVDGVRIGVARGVTKALIGKVMDKDGQGSSAAVAAAIQWALQGRANIISMSIGFDFPGLIGVLQSKYDLPPTLAASKGLRIFRDNLRLFNSLMMYAQAQASFGTGTVFVAASGNESRTDQNPAYQIEVSLPAASNGIVSVGALKKVQDRFSVAPFSNINPTVSAHRRKRRVRQTWRRPGRDERHEYGLSPCRRGGSALVGASARSKSGKRQARRG